MNKKYMDFVPVKKGATGAVVGGAPEPVETSRPVAMPKAVVSRPVAAPKPVAPKPVAASRSVAALESTQNIAKPVRNPGMRLMRRRVEKPAPKVEPDVEKEVEIDEIDFQKLFEERDAARAKARGGNAEFGVIEDYHAKFVKTEVEKRPLSTPEDEIKKAKSRKLVKGPLATVRKTTAVPRSVEKPVENSRNTEKQTLKIPRAQFVNLEKVEKRPLSKNTYTKKVVAPKEVPSGPVTIISKPEKDSRAGLIVTIIITIILGAAAGTVAFLLLPK